MNYMDFGSNLWANGYNSFVFMSYMYKELDRKYNPNTKLRKLKETDPDLEQDLKGKVCIITGGSRGIGAEVVKVLLKKDCHVITGSSSKSESERQKRHDLLVADIPSDKGKLDIWHLDLNSLDSVTHFAKRFKETGLALNYFIANAGVMLESNQRRSLTDDLEEHLVVNYLSHCLLIDHFLDNMRESGKQSKHESRIVLVSSIAHRMANIRLKDINLKSKLLPPYFAYGRSKLALIMFANRMARWLDEKGGDWRQSITVNSLHPGLCDTQMLSKLPIPASILAQASRSAKEGAETTIYTTLSKEMNGISGKYLEDCVAEQPSIDAIKVNDQNELWNITWNLLNKWTIHEWTKHT